MDFTTFSRSLDSYRDEQSTYQGLALFTGGKDSTYLLYLLSKLKDFRVLALTIDNWFISENTWRNINRVLRALSVDYMIFRPSWNIVRDLYKMSVLKRGTLCTVCEALVTVGTYGIAMKLNIPAIFWGLAPSQFRTQPHWIIHTDFEYWKKIYKRYLEGLGEVAGFNTKAYQDFLRSYLPPIDKSSSLPHHVFPYLALGYDLGTIERTIQKLGWEYPRDVVGLGTNCTANHLHYYLRSRACGEKFEALIQRKTREGMVSPAIANRILQEDFSEEAAVDVLDSIGLYITPSALLSQLPEGAIDCFDA